MTSAKILIVEDEIMLAKELCRGLEQSGYEVVGRVTTGEDAVRMAMESEPDLILMDIRLGGDMDGIEASSLISSRLDTAIIYLTAHTANDVFERAKITDPYGYLTKPISPQELARTVEMALHRHEADKRVKESEYRLSSYLKSINEMGLGIFVVDRNYAVRHMNPIMVQWFGDQTGRICYESVMNSSAPCPFCRLSDVIDESEIVRYEPTAPDGRTFSIVAAPLKDKDGSVSKMEIIQDITERKRLEESLEKRLIALTKPLDTSDGIEFGDLFSLDDIQNLQDRVARAAGVASIITDIEGNPITRPSNFCRLCEDIIRQTDRGLMNCFLSDAVIGRHHPEGPIIQPCLSGGLWDAGASISIGSRHIANWLIGQVRNETQTEEKMREYAREIGADEDTVVAAFRQVPVMSLEQFTEIAQAFFTLANLLSDIAYQNIQQARFISESQKADADKARLQRQLLRSKKMEAVGTLAGGIAHDFNNLLQIVLGYSDLLLFDRNPGSPEYEALQVVRQAAKDGSDLAKRILMFGRRVEANTRPVKLTDELKRMKRTLSRVIPKMIKVELLGEHDLKMVNADASQLEQVLLNLAVNAQHAMPDGGRLTLETANVTLDEEFCRNHLDVHPGEYVLLSVTDTGTGMDKDVVDHIFEPFYTTKGLGEGTGLGLAMVYGIIKSHHGHIGCYSEPGVGTTFKIYLPAIEEETEPETDVTRQMPAFGTETILLVDDEERLRKLGETMLTRSGYKVLTAGNGKEALEEYRLNKDEIALVILDLIMPEMGGKQCLEELLKIDPAPKILVASGYSVNGPTKDALAAGAKGFVSKPYDATDFLRMVRKVLDET